MWPKELVATSVVFANSPPKVKMLPGEGNRRPKQQKTLGDFFNKKKTSEVSKARAIIRNRDRRAGTLAKAGHVGMASAMKAQTRKAPQPKNNTKKKPASNGLQKNTKHDGKPKKNAKTTMKTMMKTMKKKTKLKKDMIAFQQDYKRKGHAKRLVWLGKKVKTVGGLRKCDLVCNPEGKIVSKVRSRRGKKLYVERHLDLWRDGLLEAREEAGAVGFIKVKRHGTELEKGLLAKTERLWKEKCAARIAKYLGLYGTLDVNKHLAASYGTSVTIAPIAKTESCKDDKHSLQPKDIW